MNRIRRQGNGQRRFLAAVLSIIVSGHARADSIPMSVNGFFSTYGMVSSNHDNYVDGVNQTPDPAQHTRLGLNVNSAINPQWHVAGQFLATGHRAGGEIELEWAFVTWRPFPFISVRIGKQNIGLWIASETIAVGSTYPWLRPPEEIYNVSLRTLAGISTEASIPLGPFELTLATSFGSGRTKLLRDDYTAVGNPIRSYELSLASDDFLVRVVHATSDATLDHPLFHLEDFQIEQRSAGVSWNPGNWFAQAEIAVSKGAVPSREADKARVAASAARTKILQNPDSFRARKQLEAAQTNLLFHEKPLVNSTGYYATLGYQWDAFLPHVSFGSMRSEEGNLFSGDNDRLGCGIRYDVDLNIDVKLEYHYTRPRNGTSGLFMRRSIDDFLKTSWKPAHIVGAGLDVTF